MAGKSSPPLRLLVICEGPTEKEFVEEILKPHFIERGCQNVFAKLIDGKGGIPKWTRARRDILRFTNEDPGRLVTTFVDYYGLPEREGRAWPGRKEARQKPPKERADWVEAKILEDLGKDIDPTRFIPFVCMYEFEALLFSDCHAFAKGIYRPDLEQNFQSIRNQFHTPEDINDSRDTAPSKRVEGLMPKYGKPLYGNLAALEIGLDKMRAECCHFNQWLAKLEMKTR